MLSLLAKLGANVHVYPPVKKDGRWYGAIRVKIGAENVDLMASASEQFLKEAYSLALSHVTFGPQPPSVAGYQEHRRHRLPQETTLKDRLAGLVPYMPIEGLTDAEFGAVDLLVRASEGCEKCIDRLITIHQSPDEDGYRSARAALSNVVRKALERKEASRVSGTAGTEELDTFLRHLIFFST